MLGALWEAAAVCGPAREVYGILLPLPQQALLRLQPHPVHPAPAPEEPQRATLGLRRRYSYSQFSVFHESSDARMSKHPPAHGDSGVRSKQLVY